MKRRKDDIAKKFADELQLPETAVHNTFTIELNSNTEVTINGCMGMVEYSEEHIAINLGSKIVHFYGSNMEISTFFDFQAVIKGTVISMDFST